MGNHHSGRRPDPSRLKLLRGKKPLNLLEPAAPVGVVEVPAGLSPGAARVWGQMAPICLNMGTLTIADVPAFVAYCELQGSFDQLMAQKSAPGFAVLSWGADATGAPVATVHPLLRVERETAAALRAYYEHFGLTPASRSRIYVRPHDTTPEVSKWA
jgi:P27 family predicted phage terminase small subunit